MGRQAAQRLAQLAGRAWQQAHSERLLSSLDTSTSFRLQQCRGAAALPARAEVHEDFPLPLPQTRVDEFGAVSVLAEDDDVEASRFRNVDGQRLEDGRYAAFMAEISSFIPKERQFTDPVRTFAYGTDASFYR